MSTNKDLQHWLGRNRPPRVQITYDVETMGATVKETIPFIMGIIGDFAGGDRPAQPLSERVFVQIDRDNFTTVMAGLQPALNLGSKQPFTTVRTAAGSTVQAVTDPEKAFPVNLAFAKIDDFEPQSIIQNVAPVQALCDLQLRDRLEALFATALAQT